MSRGGPFVILSAPSWRRTRRTPLARVISLGTCPVPRQGAAPRPPPPPPPPPPGGGAVPSERPSRAPGRRPAEFRSALPSWLAATHLVTMAGRHRLSRHRRSSGIATGGSTASGEPWAPACGFPSVSPRPAPARPRCCRNRPLSVARRPFPVPVLRVPSRKGNSAGV